MSAPLPRLLTAVAAVLALTAPAAAHAAPASPATATAATSAARTTTYRLFTRAWVGHTRGFVVRADHTAVEDIYSGCCDHVVTVHLRLSDARGDLGHGRMRARVTSVRVFDGTYRRYAPHRGDVVTLRIERSVLHEPLTGTTYCTGAAGRRGVCGA